MLKTTDPAKYQAVLQAKETLRQVENMNLQNGLELELKSCRLSMNTPDFADILNVTNDEIKDFEIY